MSCVVCIALGGDQVISCMRHELSLMLLFEEGPYPPLSSLGGQGYMEILAKYELKSPTQILLG
jgi:hypothetical protein